MLLVDKNIRVWNATVFLFVAIFVHTPWLYGFINTGDLMPKPTFTFVSFALLFPWSAWLAGGLDLLCGVKVVSDVVWCGGVGCIAVWCCDVVWYGLTGFTVV